MSAGHAMGEMRTQGRGEAAGQMSAGAFATWNAVEVRGDDRYDGVRFADWYLFHRGLEHAFDGVGFVGRSKDEHALLGAYGDAALDRPRLLGGLDWCYCGDPRVVHLPAVSVQLATADRAIRILVHVHRQQRQHSGLTVNVQAYEADMGASIFPRDNAIQDNISSTRLLA